MLPIVFILTIYIMLFYHQFYVRHLKNSHKCLHAARCLYSTMFPESPCFRHRTVKVEFTYTVSLSSELENTRNIFMFEELSTEVDTTVQAEDEAKLVAIIIISVC